MGFRQHMDKRVRIYFNKTVPIFLTMCSFLKVTSLVSVFIQSHCRTAIDKSLVEEFAKEEHADLRVEKIDEKLYSILFTLDNTTLDFNVTRKDVDVDVWFADANGNETKAEFEVF